jgi:hypothetical protein
MNTPQPWTRAKVPQNPASNVGNRADGRAWRRSISTDCLQQEFAMPLTPRFHPDQIEAMHQAYEQVRARLRLTGAGAKAAPMVERVAIRIVELAHAGEFDPDKLTETVVAEFEI